MPMCMLAPLTIVPSPSPFGGGGFVSPKSLHGLGRANADGEMAGVRQRTARRIPNRMKRRGTRTLIPLLLEGEAAPGASAASLDCFGQLVSERLSRDRGPRGMPPGWEQAP